MGHFEKVGINIATDTWVCEAFHNAFLTQMREPILQKYGWYEMDGMLTIPLCIIHASLKDALNMGHGRKMID